MDSHDMNDTDLAGAVAREVLGWCTPPEYSGTRWVAGGVVQDAPRIEWPLANAVLEECHRRGWWYDLGPVRSAEGIWRIEAACWVEGDWLYSATHADICRAICEVAVAGVRATESAEMRRADDVLGEEG